jgi:hypothetical protein
MNTEENLRNQMDEAKKRAQDIEAASVEKITDTKDGKVQERLYKMIDYGIRRVDYYEDQRHRFLQLGLGIMATGAGLLAVLARLNITFRAIEDISLWLFALSPLLTGIVLVYLFNRSIGFSYPYRKIVDIRSWYFTYNFPKGMDDNLNKNQRKAQKQVNDVVDALKTFLDRWISLHKQEKGFLKEDLEQVFILQLLQRYRRQQVELMSKALWYGLFLSIILLLIAVFFNATAHASPTFSTKNGDNVSLAPSFQISKPDTSSCIYICNCQSEKSHGGREMICSQGKHVHKRTDSHREKYEHSHPQSNVQKK